MFKFATKSLSVAALTAGLVVGGAGIASAGTHDEDGTSVDDSGNVVVEDNLNDLIDADVLNDSDILSNNIVNDVVDVGDILSGNEAEFEGNGDENNGDHEDGGLLSGGLLG